MKANALLLLLLLLSSLPFFIQNNLCGIDISIQKVFLLDKTALQRLITYYEYHLLLQYQLP